MAEANNTEPNKLALDSRLWIQRDNQTTDKLQDWASGTGDRLKAASISTLALGSVAFVMVICLILHEDDWVARIVAKFPKKDNEAEEEPLQVDTEDRGHQDKEKKEEQEEENKEDKEDQEDNEDKGDIVDIEDKADIEGKADKEDKKDKNNKEDKEEKGKKDQENK